MTHLACLILLHTREQSAGKGLKLGCAWRNVHVSVKYYHHFCVYQSALGGGNYIIQTATTANILNLTQKNNSDTTMITLTGQKSPSPPAPKLPGNNPDYIKQKSLIDVGTMSREKSALVLRNNYSKYRKNNAKNF